MIKENIQLSQLIKDNSPKTNILENRKIFRYHYPRFIFNIMKKSFYLVEKLFYGKFSGYKACNTEYHNFEHTMEALLATSRLLDGYNLTNPALHKELSLNLLIAAVFHDIGYIQESWDNEGTGAKHTLNHVERGISFLEMHHNKFGIDTGNVEPISRIIRCTNFNIDFNSIPFSSSEERIAGSILGTADILGQMSNRIYLEKLLFLYYEFKEANIPGYNTEFDILKRNIEFYRLTQERFKEPLMNRYKLAQDHFRKRFNIDSNLYVEAINRQIAYLQTLIKDESKNFRHKLKRADWIHQLPPDRTVTQ